MTNSMAWSEYDRSNELNSRVNMDSEERTSMIIYLKIVDLIRVFFRKVYILGLKM